MDDFEYENPEEIDDIGDEGSGANQKGIRERYDDAKDTADKAREFRDKRRKANEAKKVSEGAGKEATKQASQNVGKAAGNTAAKEAGKTAAKEAGKTVAKEAGKTAAKGGAKAAVAASGAATAGVGTAVAAAMEVADRLNQVRKKAEEKLNAKMKENVGVDLKTTKRTFILALILLPLLIFIPVMAASAMFLASEDTYNDLQAIIQKREKRYAESGKSIKPLLLMTNDEIDEILGKDYEADEDFSYATYLEAKYNKDYDNFIPSDSNSPSGTYTEKIQIVSKYLKAGRDNFNKVNWLLVGGTGSVDVKQYDLAGKKSIFTDPGHLSMPDVTKYKYSPNASEQQMKDMYVDMLYKHLQMWVVPFALNVASTDNEFGQDVLDNMSHPITVSLFQLDRLTKNTTTYYYLETTVHVQYYDVDYDYDEFGNQTGMTRTPTTSETFDSTTQATWTDSLTAEYSDPILKKDANDEYIRAGVKTAATVARTTVPYKHVPKVTDAQDFYSVIKAKFKIDPIDEAKTPVEKTTVLDSSGKEVITEIWDEQLLDDGTEIKDYKVSYYKAEDYTTLGRKISRVEWLLDFGAGPNEMFPTKTADEKAATKLKYQGDATTEPVVQGYSYSHLEFGYLQIEKYYKWLATNGLTGTGALNTYFIPEGGFYWPVQAVLGRGKDIDDLITSDFGPRTDPVTGALNSFHGGIDITHDGIGNPGTSADTSYGPDIVATQKGIAYVKSDPDGYGQYVVIDHQNGYFSIYGHLYSVSVTNGQEVTQGQKIGVMGTRGKSTGVHLHFEIIEAGSINDIYRKENKRDPRLYFNDDGSTILPSSQGLSAFGQQTIGAMVAKAIELAGEANIRYNQNNRQTASTVEGLDNMTISDCSAFVSSLFKTYLNVNTGTNTSGMQTVAQAGGTQNGWTVKMYEYNDDPSVLRPGDMVWRDGHVGLYVGGGKQVDLGGPGSANPPLDDPWRGPKHRDVGTSYSHYIRWTNPEAEAPIGGGTSNAIDPTSIDLTGVLSDPRTLECFRVLLSGEMGTMSGISGVDVLAVGSFSNQAQTSSLFSSKYNSWQYPHGWTGTDYQMGRVAVATTVVNRAEGSASNLFGVMTARSQYTTVTGYAQKTGEYAKNLNKYQAFNAEEKAAIDAAIRVAITNSNNGYSVIGTCKNFWSYGYYMENPSGKTGLYNIAGNLFFRFN